MENEHLSESQIRVLLALEESDVPMTYEELAETAGLSYDGVRGRVSELISKGLNIQKLKEGRNTLLEYDSFSDKPKETLDAPRSYGDMISKRTKSLEDFYGMTSFLNKMRELQPKKRKKKALKIRDKCGLLLLSDLHIGGVVKRDDEEIYNTEVAFERMRLLSNSVVQKIRENDLETIYIALLGDLVEGDAIYKNQSYRIEKAAIEQVQDATKAISEFIKTVAEEGVQVIAGCVRGNHGITNYKNLEEDNWDNVVYDMLNLVFADDPNVTVQHFAENQAKIRILDRNILLTHGDKLGEQIRTASGAKTFRGLVGKHKLQDHDFVLIGHLHTFEIMLDQSKFLIRNGALTDTSDYALSHNMYNEPTQVFILLETGVVYPKFYPINFR